MTQDTRPSTNCAARYRYLILSEAARLRLLIRECGGAGRGGGGGGAGGCGRAARAATSWWRRLFRRLVILGLKIYSGGANFKHSPHGPNIYKDTKPQMSAFLKNWPAKVLGGRCRCSSDEGGRWTSEKVRGGASSQEGSKIPKGLTVSRVYKLY
jgi:hypothetical protein